jgi:hypothetical protein
VAALRVLPDDQAETHTGLDGGGVVLIGLALLLLAVPLLEGRDSGWPAWMLVCLVCSAPAFAVFLGYERRLAGPGGSPLVRIELFRSRTFAGGVPIAMLFMASYARFLLLLAVYLQAGLGFSPLHSGAVYTPAAVGFFITSLAAPRLVPLLGGEPVRSRHRPRTDGEASKAGRDHQGPIRPSRSTVGRRAIRRTARKLATADPGRARQGRIPDGTAE